MSFTYFSTFCYFLSINNHLFLVNIYLFFSSFVRQENKACCLQVQLCNSINVYKEYTGILVNRGSVCQCHPWWKKFILNVLCIFIKFSLLCHLFLCIYSCIISYPRRQSRNTNNHYCKVFIILANAGNVSFGVFHRGPLDLWCHNLLASFLSFFKNNW